MGTFGVEEVVMKSDYEWLERWKALLNRGLPKRACFLLLDIIVFLNPNNNAKI